MISYQFGLLCVDRITELQQSLELIVLCECDYLHDCTKLGENLSAKNHTYVSPQTVDILPCD